MRLNLTSDLLFQQLQMLFSAETQLILALPRIADRSSDPSLRAALEEHLKQTEVQAQRLATAAEALGVSASGRRCYAIEGLLKQGDEAMGVGGEFALVEQAIIASCQAVEQYEVGAYQELIRIAKLVQRADLVELAQMTLKEEQDASSRLGALIQQLGASGNQSGT